MADNVVADAGSGGATFAADDIGGVHYPRTKIVLGADGAADNDVDAGQQTMAASVPVVIASDQTTLPDTVGSTTALGALNDAASVALAGQNAVVMFIAAGTLAATITPEYSADGGSNWETARFLTPTAATVGNSVGLTNPNSATTRGILVPIPATHVRARVSAYTSGSANCTLRAVSYQSYQMMCGTDSGVPRTILTASDGSVRVDPTGTTTQPISNAHLTSLGGAISGTEVQVDVVGALPAGTNAIGKLAANSGVDIGDVDILSIAAGDNNIGNVDVASIAAGDNNIGNVDVVTLPATPAGTNLIGRVSASDETSTVYQGTTARTPAFAIIDAATSGDNTLLSAQGSGNIIRVLALYLVSAGTVTVRFESGASGTALSGQMNLVANTGFVLPYNPVGWFQTAANTLLNLELSGNVSVDGGFTYIVVT